MDDYRDLITTALALLCAGLMLVAGLLLVEWRARHADHARGIEAPKSEGSRPLISNGAPSNSKVIEFSTEIRWKRPA